MIPPLSPALRRRLGRIKRALLPRTELQMRIIANSGLWDEAWFRRRYPDLPRQTDALRQFVRRGARLHLQPNPLFDMAYYLRMNPDVAASGVNPLYHYLIGGWREGRRPNPLFRDVWYWNRYPDAARDGVLPLRHFLEQGDAQGLDPHPLFQTTWYRAQYPEVASSGLPALAHYLFEGEARGLRPNPWFDPAHYRRQRPELPDDVCLLQHYHETGAFADIDPSAEFSCAAYRSQHPGLPATLPPLEHHLNSGRRSITRRPPPPDLRSALRSDITTARPPADPDLLHPPLRWYIDDNPSRVRAILNAGAGASLPPRQPSAAGLKLAVLIVTLDRPQFIIPLVQSLAEARKALQHDGIDLHVYLGDTGSTDASVLSFYQRLPRGCGLRVGLRYHYSRCNNALLSDAADADLVLFLNNDIVFDDAAASLRTMLTHLRTQPQLGLLGALLRFPDGSVQHEGIAAIDSGPLRGFVHHPGARQRPTLAPGAFQRSLAATGALLLARREVLEATGGFDEAYAAECQDVELCLAAARAGYETQVIHAGRIVHHENGTRPPGEENWADRRRLMRRWQPWIEDHWL